jgi:undecaprenyl diphosphate synthase
MPFERLEYMVSPELNKKNIPQHIAIIMDGNGRWAKGQGMPRIFGHKNAIKAVREATEGGAEIGVKNITLYAFSTENSNRPKIEISALMELLVSSLTKELETLTKNNIRLLTIGNQSDLPKSCQKSLLKTIEATKDNTRMNLILALSYSSRWEIIKAVKQIIIDAKQNKIDENQLDASMFESYLTTAGIPDPELIIRTSGEQRISNFLLWQAAYSEFCFLEKKWPDFTREDLKQAIYEYQNRERRFGKTSEQL